VRVRPREQADETAVATFLSARGSRRVARRGELVDPLEHPALLAEDAGRLAGVAGYMPGGERWELLTLHASESRAGVGTALLSALERAATTAGCNRLWVVTTNDNLDALRFYQRRGFRLSAMRPGAVDASRERLKPELPVAGDHGIPLRDELELEKEL
jgi:GNAT superfamily N-acetyltransferase